VTDERIDYSLVAHGELAGADVFDSPGKRGQYHIRVSPTVLLLMIVPLATLFARILTCFSSHPSVWRKRSTNHESIAETGDICTSGFLLIWCRDHEHAHSMSLF